MKTTKTIPFDWELYNNNRYKYKVVTKSGNEVTQLTYFTRESPYKIIGVYNDSLHIRRENGYYSSENIESEHDFQLQYEQEVVESWANLYESVNGQRHIQISYNTKEEAVERIANTANAKYIKTINLNEL